LSRDPRTSWIYFVFLYLPLTIDMPVSNHCVSTMLERSDFSGRRAGLFTSVDAVWCHVSIVILYRPTEHPEVSGSKFLYGTLRQQRQNDIASVKPANHLISIMKKVHLFVKYLKETCY